MEEKSTRKYISTKKKWISTGAYRGYWEPIYHVAGANDTGMASDSPCPSDVATKELKMVKGFLRRHRIGVKEMACQTSNVFCVHRYIVVSEADYMRARQLVSEHYNSKLRKETRLLYINEYYGTDAPINGTFVKEQQT